MASNPITPGPSDVPLRSPLLELPGAVAAEGIDAGVPLHYGDPFREQRTYDAGAGFVDRSHRGVVTVTGGGRLAWLHSLSSQHLEALQPGESVTTLVLSPQGHVEFAIDLVDDGTTSWLLVEPHHAAGLTAFLDSMRFMLEIDVADVTTDWATVTVPPDAALPSDLLAWSGPVGVDLLVPRSTLPHRVGTFGPPVGLWAYEAMRVAAHQPRQGFETDHKTLPHEVGWIGTAVHLSKGCYRGQETVARVHNIGAPPRRLVFLHLDGSVERLPELGSAVTLAGVGAEEAGDGHEPPRSVGRVTSAARHFELGPIALAVVKRTAPVDADLFADGISATQEVVVDPEAGLHVGATIREHFRS